MNFTAYHAEHIPTCPPRRRSIACSSEKYRSARYV